MNKPNDFDLEVEYDTRRRMSERIVKLEGVCKDLEYKIQQLQRDMDWHRSTEGHPTGN
uniref:Uncharacterized protein n=1 Tax=viral metagenome TaxID=1070528 RepID=A0A6M3LTE8_9ZZZZ